VRKILFAGALALAGTACAPIEVQAGCHERGPVRTALRNAAERWKDRLSRAGRVLVAVAERVTPTVAVQFERDRPALLFSYRISPASCAGDGCKN
jgi:hypothetical protein